MSGTAPILPRDEDPPEDAYEQARICIGIIARALGEAGARLEDVVRTRIYVTNILDWERVGRAHGEFFREIRPATSMVEVARLIDRAMLVEIEAYAIIPEEDAALSP